MCRLGGVALGTAPRTPAQNRRILDQLEDLLCAMDIAQGGDGVGISIHYPDGSYRLWKAPCFAWDALPEWDEDLLDALDGAVLVQMHARLATCGPSENPANLHPIVRGPIVGAHNGMVFNDVEIFDAFKLKRKGEVDSEALFALLEIMAPDLDPMAVQDALLLIDGWYAFTAATERVPGRVLLVSGNIELFVGRDPKTHAVWWASRRHLLPARLRRRLRPITHHKKEGFIAVVDALHAKPRTLTYPIQVDGLDTLGAIG
ncbi:MAG TPA: hypothetical protein VIK75_00035 [Calditerricola sp.]